MKIKIVTYIEMHTHTHSSSSIIRCLHIPKEPLQSQHDLDWHRDVMNTIKPKQSRDQSKEQSREQNKAKQRQPNSYSSYH